MCNGLINVQKITSLNPWHISNKFYLPLSEFVFVFIFSSLFHFNVKYYKINLFCINKIDLVQLVLHVFPSNFSDFPASHNDYNKWQLISRGLFQRENCVSNVSTVNEINFEIGNPAQ